MSDAYFAVSVLIRLAALTDDAGKYSAVTWIGRPSLSRCRPRTLSPTSFKDVGSADWIASSSAESFPQQTFLSWKTVSTEVASTSTALRERAVSAGRSLMRTSLLG